MLHRSRPRFEHQMWGSWFIKNIKKKISLEAVNSKALKKNSKYILLLVSIGQRVCNVLGVNITKTYVITMLVGSVEFSRRRKWICDQFDVKFSRFFRLKQKSLLCNLCASFATMKYHVYMIFYEMHDVFTSWWWEVQLLYIFLYIPVVEGNEMRKKREITKWCSWKLLCILGTILPFSFNTETTSYAFYMFYKQRSVALLTFVFVSHFHAVNMHIVSNRPVICSSGHSFTRKRLITSKTMLVCRYC